MKKSSKSSLKKKRSLDISLQQKTKLAINFQKKNFCTWPKKGLELKGVTMETTASSKSPGVGGKAIRAKSPLPYDFPQEEIAILKCSV